MSNVCTDVVLFLGIHTRSFVLLSNCFEQYWQVVSAEGTAAPGILPMIGVSVQDTTEAAGCRTNIDYRDAFREVGRQEGLGGWSRVWCKAGVI